MVGKILLVVLAIFVIITIYSVNLALRTMKRMNRYTEVKKGMTEQEALNILGKDYTDKMIKPNYVKYTWEIKNKKYTGIKKVELEIFKDEVINVVGTR